MNGFSLDGAQYGMGFGIEFRKVIAPQTEFLISLGISGLSAPEEETMDDFLLGQTYVVDKYRRAWGATLLVGVRERLFAGSVDDRFRIFSRAAVGAAVAHSYPYFHDANGNGYRELFTNYFEPVFDRFEKFSEGNWHRGVAGEIKFGVDVGSSFTWLISIEAGYFFYYFPEGIQMMTPNQPVEFDGHFAADSNGNLILEPNYDARHFFGTPQLRVVFGRFR